MFIFRFFLFLVNAFSYTQDLLDNQFLYSSISRRILMYYFDIETRVYITEENRCKKCFFIPKIFLSKNNILFQKRI